MAEKTEVKKFIDKKKKAKYKKIAEIKKESKVLKKIIDRRERIEQIEEDLKKPPFKIKYNKGGQPTKFETKYADEMLRYFESVVEGGYYENYIEEQVAGKIPQIIKVVKQRAKAIPMFEKYALSIGVDDRTLLNWALKRNDEGKLEHIEFFRSYKRCLSIQAMMMKELGMNGSYVQSIVRLLLSAEHGIYEVKEENDNTKKGENLKEINDTNIDDNLQDILK